MVDLRRSKPLKKELGLLDVYAIATGATLSAGFFLLPGLAAAQAGPAIVLSYMIAAIPLVPAMFSIIELATAMPRAGGVYYFLDRTLGPLVGTIGGIGTWLALVLKVAFALVGMGAYLSLFLPDLPMIPLAIALAVGLGIVNFFGTSKSGGFQIALVAGLLTILAAFFIGGIPKINIAHFQNILTPGASNILSTAGLVYISYVGVTNVASLSEEVRDPERNLPLGVILALVTAILAYGVGTSVMVGVLSEEQLAGNLTPVAAAGGAILGRFGTIVLTVAALLAFLSVANAGSLSASRYPLAMSRDHMLPRFFRRLGRYGTPTSAIVVTVLTIVAILLLLDPTRIAKLASAFQLLMFALVCLAVIVIRESRIDSYDPGYRSPFYPCMQILGILSAALLIWEMGWLPLAFTVGLVLLGGVWYWFYAKDKVVRTGAIYHIFERLGQLRYHGLDGELRGILKEKGLRGDDPFDEIVARSLVIDLAGKGDFADLVNRVSDWLSEQMPYSASEIAEQFLEGTRIGATPVTHGVALPHVRVEGLEQPELAFVRCKGGVTITFDSPLTDHDHEEATFRALFFLASPDDNPAQHLRILAQIAGRVDDESFALEWEAAQDEQQLRETLLHEDSFLSLLVAHSTPTEEMIDRPIREVQFPVGCLVALLSRGGQTIVPQGDTVFQDGDRLTLIGGPESMRELRARYTDHP